MDEAAEEGLRALESLSPDSEVHRLKADLLAVMIRSDYRAKKYRADMEEAATRAVELDPANARAYVSQAKPYVFAEPHEGGDPAAAVTLLSKALDLNPDLESARCLRGLAYEKAGEIEKARKDWALALENNPHCRPAKEELARLDSE
jgi:tetratricopeptide (TPR) repeat protein